MTPEGGPRPRNEHLSRPDADTGVKLTPEALFADNGSDDSVRIRRYWNRQRADRQLTLEWDCDDARSIPSLRGVQVRSISTGGKNESYESYEGLLNDSAVRVIAVVSHYDPETVVKGRAPQGCGGLEVKRQQRANGAPIKGGPYGFVHEYVSHEDPLVQAIKSADQISRHTDKPVLAAARNHLTQEVTPVTLIQHKEGGAQLIYSSVPVGDILDGSYDAAEIYANGIPHLMKTDPLLSDFYTYFAENEHLVGRLEDRYPNLRDLLKVQNPKAIIISTQVRPLRSRYYDLFGTPGSAFEVTIARGKKSIGAAARITKRAIEEALNQAGYAMIHALTNRGLPTEQFNSTDTVLVESVHLDDARRIGQSLSETGFGSEWIRYGNHIIVAEVRAGEITGKDRIEYFLPKAA